MRVFLLDFLYDDLKTMLNEHYHCIDEAATEASEPVAVQSESHDDELDEEVPMDFDDKPTPVASEESNESDDPLEDDKVKELLAGLDDV